MVENQYALSKDELPILTELMDLLKLHPCFKGEAILKGRDPILASPHKLGESVANILLLNGVLASAIWELRTGEKNNLSLDIKDAIQYMLPKS